MKVSDFNLEKVIKYDPESGKVTVGAQRMVIMSSGSVGHLLDEIYRTGGENMARIFFRRWGDAAGRDDAALLKAEYKPETDIDWMAFGPTMHSWEGIVRAVPEVLEFERGSGKFYMKGTWDNSFFAELWLKHVGKSQKPVCDILTGYATGYLSTVTGLDILAKEPTCVACGDGRCSFEAKVKTEW